MLNSQTPKGYLTCLWGKKTRIKIRNRLNGLFLFMLEAFTFAMGTPENNLGYSVDKLLVKNFITIRVTEHEGKPCIKGSGYFRISRKRLLIARNCGSKKACHSWPRKYGHATWVRRITWPVGAPSRLPTAHGPTCLLQVLEVLTPPHILAFRGNLGSVFRRVYFTWLGIHSGGWSQHRRWSFHFFNRYHGEVHTLAIFNSTTERLGKVSFSLITWSKKEDESSVSKINWPNHER